MGVLRAPIEHRWEYAEHAWEYSQYRQEYPAQVRQVGAHCVERAYLLDHLLRRQAQLAALERRWCVAPAACIGPARLRLVCLFACLLSGVFVRLFVCVFAFLFPRVSIAPLLPATSPQVRRARALAPVRPRPPPPCLPWGTIWYSRAVLYGTVWHSSRSGVRQGSLGDEQVLGLCSVLKTALGYSQHGTQRY
jgi:hypothetical protein